MQAAKFIKNVTSQTNLNFQKINQKKHKAKNKYHSYIDLRVKDCGFYCLWNRGLWEEK